MCHTRNKTQTIMYGVFTLMFVLTFSYYPKSCHLATVKLFTVDKKCALFIGLSQWRPILDSRIGLFLPKSQEKNEKGYIVDIKPGVNVFGWVLLEVYFKTIMWVQVGMHLFISAGKWRNNSIKNVASRSAFCKQLILRLSKILNDQPINEKTLNCCSTAASEGK